MPQASYIVDRKLGAVHVSKLLEVRAQLREEGTLDQETATPEGKPVLTNDQKLAPDTLYPSSSNQAIKYYLPKYRLLADEAGRPAVELRHIGGQEDDDEVGRLTLTLTWTPPPAPRGIELRTIDHLVNLSLRYSIPVGSSGTASAPGQGWEQHIPLQPAQQLGDHQARSTTVFSDKAQFNAVYQAMIDPHSGATIEISMMAKVGVQTWRQVVVGKPMEKDQARILLKQDALFTQIIPKESLSAARRDPTGRRVVRMRPQPPSRPQPSATPSSSASPRPMTTQPRPVARLNASALRTAILANRSRSTTSPTSSSPSTPLRVTRLDSTASASVRVSPARTPLRIRGTTKPAASTTKINAAVLARVNTPVLTQAVAASDLKINGKKAVPTQVALDNSKKPAIVDTDLEYQENLPFAFDPGLPANQDVFAVEGFDRGGIHLLLPLSLLAPDGTTHTIYQDNLMPDVVHLAPNEFRLMREESTPFLPSLSFLASEFSTAEDDDNAEVLFRVSAVYRLEPWFNPKIVELARQELAKQGHVARFMTGVPRGRAKLSLQLDFLEGEQDRPDATIDPASGITDTLELDHDTFVRLWRERLAPSGGEVNGRVDYELFDGSTAHADVRISLWETSDEVFDVTFLGQDAQPGRYKVRLRNRIESPVRIVELLGAAVDEGVVAHAVNPGSVINQLLKPQEATDIVYQVTPPTAPVVAIEPTVLGRVEPDLNAILKLLVVTPGYSALGFSVVVKAAEGAFGPAPAGREPLTGLLVEFDDGTKTTLTPDAPEAEVSLVGRLIDQVLGAADDEHRYFHRVTNLHPTGEGARTSWLEGRGSAPLTVGTAVVQLDF